MDENVTTTVIIATSIFVSVAILTAILASFTEMKEIISLVQKTDISINASYMQNYDGKVLTGTELLNTLKKIEEEEEATVVVEYPGYEDIRREAQNTGVRESEILRKQMRDEDNTSYKYSNTYNVYASDTGGYVRIVFVNEE